jgi:putative ABC transport system permease protein
MDINTNLLKLISALIVAAFLAVPYWKKRFLPKKKLAGKEKHHA